MPAPPSGNGLRKYVGVDAVVERYSGVVSKWSIYEASRTGRIPHRKRPGCRELIFLPEELDAWEDGCELEVRHLPRGGRVVKPIIRSGS